MPRKGAAKTAEQYIDHFMRSVQKTASCWLWTGYRKKEGYGRYTASPYAPFTGSVAHRIAWQIAHGPIPDGLEVCHRCDNPPCVNPGHLFLGTHTENMRDMVDKQRNVVGARSPAAKLTDDQARELLRLYFEEGVPCHRLSEMFGLASDGPVRIVSGERYPHLYTEEYRNAYASVRRKNKAVASGEANAKLSWELVARIREMCADGVRTAEIAARFCVSKTTVNNIAAGRSWRRGVGA